MPRKSTLLTPARTKVPRTAFLVGDSMTQNGNYAQTISAGTAINGVETITTSAGHGIDVSAEAYIGGFNNDIFNGLKTVTVNVDTTNVKFACPTVINDTVGAGSSKTLINIRRMTDRNWLAIASFINNINFEKIYNFGLSGNTLAQIRRRLIRDVLPIANYGDLVQIHGGFNNIQAVAAADAPAVTEAMKLEYIGMIETCLENNLIPLIVNILPYDTAASGYNATIGQYARNLNRWLHDICYRVYPECLYLDAWAICADYATGNFKTNYSVSDKIHPSSLGAHNIAKILAPILASRFGSTRQMRGSSLIDTPATNAASTQIHPNPVNNGTGGTPSVTGAGSGTNTGAFVPDGLNCILTRSTTGANVNSRSLRADGFGYDYISTFTAQAANDQLDWIQANSMHTSVSAGDTIFAEIRLKMESIVNIDKIEFGFEYIANGVTSTSPKAIESIVSCLIVDDFTLVLRTPDLKIPPSLTSLKTRLRVRASGVGGAVITQSQPSINKVTGV